MEKFNRIFLKKKQLTLDGFKGKRLSIEALEKNGFYILENGFSARSLERLTQLRSNLINESNIQKKYLSNLRGYELGNLSIDRCFVHEVIWKLMMDSKIIRQSLELFNINKINQIKYAGGNINFPKSTPQAFHRDSNLKNKHLLLFIALEKITSFNGAQEVISDNNVKGLRYIDMLFSRLKNGSNLINMNPGDILFRYSSTWHRGTSNSSFLPRAVPLFSFNLEQKQIANKVEIKEFNKKISFSGNYAPKGKKRRIYLFMTINFTKIFHSIIYITKLFKTQ